MALKTVFDYAVPYDIMVGVWTGHSIMYDENGKYLFTGPSMVRIYWKDHGKVLHYNQEDLGDLDALIEHPQGKDLKNIIFTRDFDLIVKDKACKSKSGGEIQVEGVESRPGTYLFHLSFPFGHYYNNQYFQNPNERHIIGPYVPKGETSIGAVIAQTFTRISYDVPKDHR